ncbi:hypothetical protein [Streptomyces sp. NPDC058335]|uniref:hypothetical protein n=1 Tax=Streptomyces sp. NPDC058335 TaxID=3346451 RepID=UPI0036511020
MTARKAAAATQSWDEFWAQASGGRREVIRGVEVTVPTDIPLAMEARINDLQESESEEDFAELITLLFGIDALKSWRENGMGLLELQTVLAWGIAQANGKELTFAEAFELVKQQDDAGKAPNRAARRAASKSPSKSTGGRSKPTSSASTASARTRSRG